MLAVSVLVGDVGFFLILDGQVDGLRVFAILCKIDLPTLDRVLLFAVNGKFESVFAVYTAQFDLRHLIADQILIRCTQLF